jgi:hypothetical protein
MRAGAAAGGWIGYLIEQALAMGGLVESQASANFILYVD